MRIILRILKWFTVVLVALVILMVAINWSDQPPSPAALKMQSLLHEGSDVPDEENAFVYAMGFAAPRGSDPVRAGAECIARLNTAIHKPTINLDTDLECWASSSSNYNNAAISEILDTCATANKDCADALQENKQAIAQWLHDKDWLLQRYEGLLQRSKWHTTTEFSLYMPFPDYGGIGDGREMLLLKVWYLAAQGKGAEVQRLLNLNLRFWRTVMSSSSTLLDKMIAAAYMGKDFAFFNLVLRQLHEKGIAPSVPDEWMVPFGRDELSLEKAMAGEWAFSASILREEEMHRTLLMDGKDVSASKERSVIDMRLEDVSGYFLLPQATQNRHAEALLRLLGILDVSVKDLPQASKEAAIYMNELASVGNLLHPYNPVGNILVAIGVPAYSGYAERIYNLEGVRRAALVTTQLRASGVDMNQVSSALDRSGLRNPYDEKPFVWDAGTTSIVFKGLGPDERSTHSFLY